MSKLEAMLTEAEAEVRRLEPDSNEPLGRVDFVHAQGRSAQIQRALHWVRRSAKGRTRFLLVAEAKSALGYLLFYLLLDSFSWRSFSWRFEPGNPSLALWQLLALIAAVGVAIGYLQGRASWKEGELACKQLLPDLFGETSGAQAHSDHSG